MSDDDFERADAAAGEVVVETLPAKRNPNSVVPENVVAYREQLVQQYHKGSPSLIERLKKAGNADYEMLVIALIDEVIKETDHLLGNELVATQNGELRDASIISFKRAEVLEKAISAVQAKHELEKDSGIDADSPAMAIIFKFFLSKVKESFDRMGMGNEVNDLFFRTFSEVTENWKRELRDRFDELRNQG